MVMETQFADDAALYATFELAAVGYEVVAADFGLKLSVEKTKGMVTDQGVDEHDVTPVQVEGGNLEVVYHFPYVDSIIPKDDELRQTIKPFVVCRGPPLQLRWLHMGHVGLWMKRDYQKRVSLFGEEAMPQSEEKE